MLRDGAPRLPGVKIPLCDKTNRIPMSDPKGRVPKTGDNLWLHRALAAAKDLKGRGALNAPLAIGDVNVGPGDLVVGDGDGVVVIPTSILAEVIDTSAAREAREAEMMARLRGGETTLDIYGWE